MTLAELARRSGWSVADVAYLAGVEESTVSRFWNADDWLDRVKGRTLRSLIAVLPGVAELLVVDTLRQRRGRLIDELAEFDLVVDREAFRKIVTVEKVPEQLLANALAAALAVMRQEPHDAAANLARFWSRPQDRVLGRLWDGASLGGVFVEAAPLVAASDLLASRLAANMNSHHALLGHATLVHYVAKSTGRRVHVPDFDSLGRRTVMSYRSSVMGHIIQTGNCEAVLRYDRAVRENALLGMVERWSFPTYNRDAAATLDFSLPGSILLRKTASALVGDLRTDNEAYFFYLVRTAIPTMLESDSTLGLQGSVVAEEVRKRIDLVEHSAVRASASALLKDLRRAASPD